MCSRLWDTRSRLHGGPRCLLQADEGTIHVMTQTPLPADTSTQGYDLRRPDQRDAPVPSILTRRARALGRRQPPENRDASTPPPRRTPPCAEHCAADCRRRATPLPPSPRPTASASALMWIIASMNRSSSARSSDSVGSTMRVPATGNDMVGAWNP